MTRDGGEADEGAVDSAADQLRMVEALKLRGHALMTTPQRMWGIGNNSSLRLFFASSEKWDTKPAAIILEEVSLIAAGFRNSYIVAHALWGVKEVRAARCARLWSVRKF